MRINIKKGFTLAEVLITLTIIGVIASLTIPVLVNNTNKAEIVVRLQKDYAVLQQAFIQLNSEGSIVGNDMLWGASASNHANVMRLFASKFNTVKTCSGPGGGCWYTYSIPYLNVNLSHTSLVSNGDNAGYAKTTLIDGTLLMFYSYLSNCGTDQSTYTSGNPLDNTCGEIYVDVNNSTGPNMLGRDVFAFYITKSGIYPMGINADSYYSLPNGCNPNDAGYGSGYACTAKVLQEGAINY